MIKKEDSRFQFFLVSKCTAKDMQAVMQAHVTFECLILKQHKKENIRMWRSLPMKA